uniref:Uncharacterized protein n=1 Tax=Ditylenchus dipsaci TaxID=166011 RepID=A0A915DHK5_9BILA
MVTQLSSQPRTSQPSAYSRQYSQHQRQRQLPQLPSKSFSYPVSNYEQHHAASGQTTSTYMPVRNRLAEQESRPMNQTYTIGMANRIPMRNRSSSIDSDFADYTIHGAISGLFPRSESTKFGNRIRQECF